MEGLSFRLARPCDFAEVVNLSKGIYNGHDYLPLEFHKWLEMDNMAVMLALAGDKLVGFKAGLIVDDGKTCIRRAGRVLPEYRGRGINPKLSEALDEYNRRNFPTVSRVRFVTRYNGFSENSEFAKLKKMFEFEVLSYDIEEKTSRGTELTCDEISTEIVSCTAEYISDVMFSSPVAQPLFSDNTLIFDRVPFEPRRSNLDYMLREFENIEFFVERDGVEKCTSDCNSFPKSFSFSCVAQRVDYVHWTTYIYTNDVRLYEAQLLHQFKRACTAIKGRFIFVSSVQSGGLTSHGRTLMEEKLKLKVSDNLSERILNLYELDL